jgi:hypothetical protein
VISIITKSIRLDMKDTEFEKKMLEYITDLITKPKDERKESKKAKRKSKTIHFIYISIRNIQMFIYSFTDIRIWEFGSIVPFFILFIECPLKQEFTNLITCSNINSP